MKKLLVVIASVFTALLSYEQTLLDTAVNFSVKDTYGNVIDLYELLDSNKTVVIDFFSTA